MRRALLTCAVLGVLCLAGPAVAQDEEEVEEQKSQVQLHTHRGQFGVHAQVGLGYRVLLPYNDEYCGQDKAVCSGRSPFFLEVGMSYGITDSIELLADIRLGTERDFPPMSGGTEGPRSLVFAPGIKVYIDNEGQTKFFSTLQLAVDLTDFTGGTGAVGDGNDYGIRNVNGVMFEISKNLGFYVHFGETIGFVRWLRFEIDAGLGVQARIP